MSEVMRRNAKNPQFQQKMELYRQMMEATKTGTIDGVPVDPEILAQMNQSARAAIYTGNNCGVAPVSG